MTPAQKLDQLTDFRAGFYDCLSGWGDALFELTDAALCAPGPISSVPALSLEPAFRRSHGSLYKALSKGEIDDEQMRDLHSRFRPAARPLIFAVDASVWCRCDAECSPQRGFYHSPSQHSAGQPIVAGWNYQWISQLNFSRDSWTAPADAIRIPPDADTTTATIDQVRQTVKTLPADGEVPMFVLDAGYDPAGLSYGLADVRAQILVRIRSDRVFFTDPPERSPHPERAGRPAATAGVSNYPTTKPPPNRTPRLAWKTPATARCASAPGTTCTPACTAGAAGPAPPSRPSCPAASSESTSSDYPNPAAGPTTKRCGCGGPGRDIPTWRPACTPTCTASTSNTPTASPKTPWAGPPPPYAHPSKLTAGPGSPSPPTPSCD
jgi:DDE superfamily endonuclease